jgi:hypothetical protein
LYSFDARARYVDFRATFAAAQLRRHPQAKFMTQARVSSNGLPDLQLRCIPSISAPKLSLLTTAQVNVITGMIQKCPTKPDNLAPLQENLDNLEKKLWVGSVLPNSIHI